MTRIALAGDVMIGRGVDQIMRSPSDPVLYEGSARSALRYVELAERQSGPLPRGVDPAYVWGDTLDRLDGLDVDVRFVNLETALTARGHPWPGKGIHYRANPANADCLAAAGIDAVTLANNHVLDWSEPGLVDTVETLSGLGVAHTGAGRRDEEAWRPAVLATPGRVTILGVGTPSSGVDPAWAATPQRPGVAMPDGGSDTSINTIAQALHRDRTSDGIVVASIHWGPNWGYAVPGSYRRFARALIDEAGVDMVHGHSAHHPLGFEIHRDRLILYGCGDLINDYEGIPGHEEFRPGLGAWWLADLDSRTGTLQGLEMVPTRMHRFRLETPDGEEQMWLARLLERESLTPGVGVRVGDDVMTVTW